MRTPPSIKTYGTFSYPSSERHSSSSTKQNTTFSSRHLLEQNPIVSLAKPIATSEFLNQLCNPESEAFDIIFNVSGIAKSRISNVEELGAIIKAEIKAAQSTDPPSQLTRLCAYAIAVKCTRNYLTEKPK